MRLTDTVELWTLDAGATTYSYHSTYRANVSYAVTEREPEAGRINYREELRAIVGGLADWNPSTMQLKWRGRMFISNGPAMIRTKNGRVHHLTIPLLYL